MIEQPKFKMTSFNIIAAIILLVGIPVTLYRYMYGLGAVTNLDHNYPFGLWIAFDVLTGVALAAGGYTISTMVYIFGLRDYYPVVRPAILTAFLGYFLVGVGLAVDVGRPWRMPYPFFVSQGYTSVMFEVAACVALYLTVLFIECLPAAAEWLNLKKAHAILIRMTLALTIMGVVLSTLHQSSLGSMFLISLNKIHPLWYSTFIPLYFFVSSMIAGLSMVIFESSISHRVFKNLFDPNEPFDHNKIVLGLGKAASLVLFGYFGIKVLGVAHGDHWHLLATPYGYWFLVEIIGFVLLPCFLYAYGAKQKNVGLVKFTSAIAVFGIILNRFNVCLVAFNYEIPWDQRYFPAISEFIVSLTLVTAGLVAFKIIVTYMPIFREHPDYKGAH